MKILGFLMLLLLSRQWLLNEIEGIEEDQWLGVKRGDRDGILHNWILRSMIKDLLLAPEKLLKDLIGWTHILSFLEQQTGWKLKHDPCDPWTMASPTYCRLPEM
jgi:hypothetical protein